MTCLSGINFSLGLPNRKQYFLLEEIQLINAGGKLSLIYHFSAFHEIMDPGSGGEKNNWWELRTRSMDQAENISNHWPVLTSYRQKPPVSHRWSIISQWGFPAVTSVVSNSVRPHRRQPIRLPHPWDSPGKDTGVGCHFLLQCMKLKLLSHVWLSGLMDCSLPGSSVHGVFQARVLEWVAIAFSGGFPEVWLLLIGKQPEDFPSGSVAKTPCSHCRGPGSTPGQGTRSWKATTKR